MYKDYVCYKHVQYIPRNMHTVFALLWFVVVIHWLIYPYPSGLLHWHCGNLTIAPVPAKQPWWIWINTSYELIMNDCITTTKQSTTKPCAYFLGYTVSRTWIRHCWIYLLIHVLHNCLQYTVLIYLKQSLQPILYGTKKYSVPSFMNNLILQIRDQITQHHISLMWCWITESETCDWLGQ